MSNQFTIISNNPSGGTLNIIDNKKKTYYSSTGTTCFIGFDYGEKYRVEFEYVKFVPRTDIDISKFLGILL